MYQKNTMRHDLFKILTTLLCSFLFYSKAFAYDIFADSHVHFTWEQDEITAEEIVTILKDANVGLTIISGTPTDMALEVRKAGGDWVVPFFSPYIHATGKRDWHRNEEVIKKAKRDLGKGLYYGIGEVHFMEGFQPRTDNKIFLQLLDLAKQFDVPVLIHIDSANERRFLDLCRSNPNINLIFAHAGGILKPVHIRKILEQCNNAWIELSARDPWRYGRISNEDHTLLAGWKKLVLDYPDRFITGTDPVWSVTRGQTWDQPDEGWTHYDKLLDFHWTWMNDLPDDVRRKVSWENTNRLLKRK